MNKRPMTWLEASCIEAGTAVVFVTLHEHKPSGLVAPAGTEGVMKENCLNDIWGGLTITPESPMQQRNWSVYGGICIEGTPDPGADVDSEDWQARAPFTVIDGAEWERCHAQANAVRAGGKHHK